MAKCTLELIACIYNADDRDAAFETAKGAGISFQLFQEIGGNTRDRDYGEETAELEAARFWQLMEGEYARYGRIPRYEDLDDAVRGAELPTPQDTLEDTIRLVKRLHRWVMARKILEPAAGIGLLESDAKLATLYDDLTKIVTSTVSSETKTTRRTAAELYSFVRNGGRQNTALGLPYPWEYMTDATRGFQKGDLVTLAADTKTGKTWVGLMMAANLLRKGHKVAVQSNDMLKDELDGRMHCILAGVSYNAYSRGELAEDGLEFAEVMACADWLEDRYQGGQYSYITASDFPELRMKVSALAPDFVLVDAVVDLAKSTKSSKYSYDNQMGIMSDLKDMATSVGTVVLGILQVNIAKAIANKYATNRHSVSFNSNAYQKVDFGFTLVGHKARQELTMWTEVQRRAQSIMPITFRAKHCDDYSVVGVGDAYAHLPGAEEDEAREAAKVAAKLGYQQWADKAQGKLATLGLARRPIQELS